MSDQPGQASPERDGEPQRGGARRRRRRRAPGSDDGASPSEHDVPTPADLASGERAAAPKRQPKPRSARHRHDAGEHGLRDIVGAGKSQVGVDGALRARDVNRPTADDLAEAERDLVIVRRHWQPPADGPNRR